MTKYYGEEAIRYAAKHCNSSTESYRCDSCPYESDPMTAMISRVCEKSNDNICDSECKCITCTYNKDREETEVFRTMNEDEIRKEYLYNTLSKRICREDCKKCKFFGSVNNLNLKAKFFTRYYCTLFESFLGGDEMLRRSTKCVKAFGKGE